MILFMSEKGSSDRKQRNDGGLVATYLVMCIFQADSDCMKKKKNVVVLRMVGLSARW